jgi:hypothetical protein
MAQYRPADLASDADERAFVISTWASSYKHSHFAGLISSEDWAAVMHAQLGKLLDRPTTRALVAWDPPAFLYGHIVGDTSSPMPVVHYAYVKDPFREAGIARGLFAALGVDPVKPFIYTSRTSTVVRLTDKIPFARFSPAAARYTNYQEQRHGQRRT